MDVHDNDGWVNLGTGQDVTIKTLAETVARVVGFEGALTWDTTKPDGTPRKLLDVSKMTALGWTASTPLEQGIRAVYEEFKASMEGETLRG
jgi:GDP-L-fucose synthase